MKLETNMYVRTKWGISQYKEYETSMGKLLCMPLMNETFANIEDILKTSHSIIDLIQEGDYVNGELVTNANDVYTEDNIYIGKEVIVNHKDLIIEEEIETIVTKEQFESMSYKVED